MTDTDYRLLLQKYMMHVGKMECKDFVYRTGKPPSYFTDAEWQDLKQASVDSCRLEDVIARERKQNRGR